MTLVSLEIISCWQFSQIASKAHLAVTRLLYNTVHSYLFYCQGFARFDPPPLRYFLYNNQIEYYSFIEELDYKLIRKIPFS